MFRKKRLRKKYHQGEYAEYGFELTASFIETPNSMDKAVDEFLGKIDELGLSTSGAFDKLGLTQLIFKHKKCFPEVEEIAALLYWMETSYTNISVGPDIDLWSDEFSS